MLYEATIEIPQSTLKYLELVLAGGGNWEEDWYEDRVESFTARFANGYEADVKVVGCDEDCPYSEAVLFNPDGYQESYTDIEDTLAGDWEFYNDNNNYIIHVVGV